MVEIKGGWWGRCLEVDLSRGSWRDVEIDFQILRKLVGGKALGAWLLYTNLPPGADPLSPQAPLIVSTGPFTGTGAPCSSKFILSFKSPLKKGIASSASGGRFGMDLKSAGYDCLVIKGASKDPIYLQISQDEVEFLDASDLWGLDTAQTQRKLGKAGLVIGPAGENLVRYAAVISGERVFGRCGAGAVMGSKKLKAIIASGNLKVKIADRSKFRDLVRKFASWINNHPTTSRALRDYGTGCVLTITNATHTLPTRNFIQNYFDQADSISGEAVSRKLLGKSGCITCPIRCGRVVQVEGERIKGPEYETLVLLGSNLGIGDLDWIFRWNRLCDLYGLDTISLGGVLGFAMELKQRALADFGIEFGNPHGISELIREIAFGEGRGEELGQGVARLASKYNASEFGMHVKGLELPGYDPRGSVGLGLGYATSNRGGCHLNAGYPIYLEVMAPLTLDPYSPKSKPELVILLQNMLDALGCLVVCYFTSWALFPIRAFRLSPGMLSAFLSKLISGSLGMALAALRSKKLRRMLPLKITLYERMLSAITGVSYTTGDLFELGERCFNLERILNLREGVAAEDDSLPPRLLNEPAPVTVPLESMLQRYYELRGWDSRGRPSSHTLERLGLKELISA